MKQASEFWLRNHLIFCISWLVLLPSCSINNKQPSPVNGVLDLRNWDFKRKGIIEISGDWEFKFGQLLKAGEFDTVHEKEYARSPSVWKRKYGSTGFASYRLTILLPPEQCNLAFKVSNLGTAYSFFINDSMFATGGIVGKSKESSVPMYTNHLVEPDCMNDTTNIVFWVSNFDYRKGGMWKNLLIGDASKIKQSHRNNMSSIMMISGIWLTVGFVLMSFFVYRPKEKALLFLWAWAITILVRLLSSDDHFITEFIPGIDFQLLVRLELISAFALAPSSIIALHLLYPNEFSVKFRNFMLYSFLVFLLVSLLTKPLIFSNLVIPGQVITVGSMAYAMVRLGKAVVNKREGSIILTIGFMLALVLYIVQILFYNQLTNFNSVQLAFAMALIVAFAQIGFLARRFSSALMKVENFANELETTVQERTEELIKAQEQLLIVARQTETEKVRRRISQDIHDDISSGLNKITWMGELVKVKAKKSQKEELTLTIDKIIKSSRETCDNLIEIIWSMNPNSDDLESLLSFMRNYINKFFDETSFNVEVNFPKHIDKIELNPELKRNLFLIMKEALHNAVKYSCADSITIDFKFDGRYYILSIVDNGIGIDNSTIKGTGNGMINMKERIENVHGTFKIISEVGKGTRVILRGEIY